MVESNGPITRIELLEAVAHERELREAFRLESQRALELSQAETGRRLDILNHAHEQAMENWARSLPRELFEVTKREQDRRIDQLAIELNTIQTRHSTGMLWLGAVLAGFSLLLTALSLLVSFFAF